MHKIKVEVHFNLITRIDLLLQYYSIYYAKLYSSMESTGVVLSQTLKSLSELIEVTTTLNSLQAQYFVQLQQLISPLRCSECHGVDLYITTLQFVQQRYNINTGIDVV